MDEMQDDAATSLDASGAIERHDGDIDLVAEPIRYRRAPLLALLVIAVVPAIGLFVLQRWADDEADSYEASRDALALAEGRAVGRSWWDPDLQGEIEVDGDPTDPEGLDDIDEAGDVDVVTPLLDFRRTPAAVAAVADATRLAEAVDPVLGFVDDRSCAAVSIDGIPVTGVNEDLPVIPASNQKLLVAAVALEVLGPEHRFTTSVAVPPPVDGVVDGDIYLIGGGDPLLTSNDFPIEEDRRPAFSTTSLDPLADALVAAGVTRIRGTVIGDGTRYDDEFAVDGWAAEDVFVEAGPYDALLVNDGRVLGRTTIEDDPNRGAAREFARLLNNRGIRVDNGWGSGVASTLVPVIGSVESVPLSEVVAEMLVTSDNNTAEMLVKEIGAVAAGSGSRVAGLAVMEDVLSGWGVPMDGVVLHDGSGLSNTNRLTCAAALAVLQRSAGGPLDAGLPVAGESGTLTEEFLGSPMQGRLRAKTGTLDNEPFDLDPPAVKALSGYVDTPGAGTIEFALILNGADISLESRYRSLWSALGERFATHPGGPGADALGPRS